ncbi:MAG: ATP-binding protein, partial [Nitrospira sp.]|nr:ATP-binding protein [Nitrospira sp.]
LTRTQIKQLMDPLKTLGVRGQASGSAENGGSGLGAASAAGTSASRPMLPPGIPQYFVPVRSVQMSGNRLIYRPVVLGSALVRFADAKAGIDTQEELTWLAPIQDGAVPVEWEQATATPLTLSDLERDPSGDAQFRPLPGAATKAKQYEVWKTDLSGWLYRTQKLDLLRSPSTRDLSKPGESERDFRLRLQQAGREERDQQSDSLRKKYAPKIAALQDRIRKAEHMAERQQAESRSSQLQTAISVGATILGAFLGRKASSATYIGKATTAIRGAGRIIKESKDVTQAEDNVSALQQQLADLEAQFKAEIAARTAATDPFTEELEGVSVRPAKSNITIKLVALAWAPHWQDGSGTQVPAWE